MTFAGTRLGFGPRRERGAWSTTRTIARWRGGRRRGKCVCGLHVRSGAERGQEQRAREGVRVGSDGADRDASFDVPPRGKVSDALLRVRREQERVGFVLPCTAERDRGALRIRSLRGGHAHVEGDELESRPDRSEPVAVLLGVPRLGTGPGLLQLPSLFSRPGPLPLPRPH